MTEVPLPLFLGISLAGGIGAVCRFALDGAITARSAARLPIGTITINLTGSFLLGLLTGLVLARAVGEQAQLVLGAGFLGGYTTFSTASLETVRLLRERRWVAGAVSGIGVLIGGGAAALVGLALGSLAGGI